MLYQRPRAVGGIDDFCQGRVPVQLRIVRIVNVVRTIVIEISVWHGLRIEFGCRVYNSGSVPQKIVGTVVKPGPDGILMSNTCATNVDEKQECFLRVTVDRRVREVCIGCTVMRVKFF